MMNSGLVLIALAIQGPPAAPQIATRPVSPPASVIGELLTGDLDQVTPTLNGRRIYYGTETREIWLFDVASQRSTRIAVDAVLYQTSVSALGNRIAFGRSADSGSTGKAIWTMPLDPRTGLPAGTAKRVTLGNGRDPSLSPDGNWIAFQSISEDAASDCGWSSEHLAAPQCRRHNLVVIPSNGGSERVLLNEIVVMDYIKWSPDQQWLYFGAARYGSTRPGVLPMRVAVSGGKPELIAADQILINDVEQGLSPDGRFLALTETASTSGARVLVLMDLRGSVIGRLPWADMWLSSTELFLWYSHHLKSLKSVSLVDGNVRDVFPASYDIGTPAWEPDGRRFAVLSNYERGKGHRLDSSVLLIANADGSSLRAISVPASESRVVWSPDGRWIAMTERPWLGARSQLLGLGITVVEVASGRTRRLRTAVSQDIASLRWTSDSKHVLYDHSPSEGPSIHKPRVFRPVIRQAGLDGSDVVVRALPSGGGGPGLAFLSDTSLMVSDDAVTYVRSLTSDRFVGLWQGRRQASSASQRGDLVAVAPPRDTAERTRRIADILTSAGVHVASLTFPTALLRGGGGLVFTPDNKSLLAWGVNEAAKECCVLYLAPLDGGPVRTLTSFANTHGVPPFALSADGKTVLFAPSGSTWMTFWSVDVSGLLRGAPKN